jgi:hypothetical protein
MANPIPIMPMAERELHGGKKKEMIFKIKIYFS